MPQVIFQLHEDVKPMAWTVNPKFQIQNIYTKGLHALTHLDTDTLYTCQSWGSRKYRTNVSGTLFDMDMKPQNCVFMKSLEFMRSDVCVRRLEWSCRTLSESSAAGK